MSRARTVGSLDELTFVRCHTEERRIALLLRSLSGQQNLVGVVRVALSLSRDGSLPPFDAARNRKRAKADASCSPKKYLLVTVCLRAWVRGGLGQPDFLDNHFSLDRNGLKKTIEWLQ